MKQLRDNWILWDLTLGQVWISICRRMTLSFGDVILFAHDEMALEKFLKQVREAWQTYVLELINYQKSF
jgi:dynein heavy chain 1